MVRVLETSTREQKKEWSLLKLANRQTFCNHVCGGSGYLLVLLWELILLLPWFLRVSLLRGMFPLYLWPQDRTGKRVSRNYFWDPWT